MKKKLIIEIDCPEGFDDQYDIDVSGAQVFHDLFRCNALSYLLEQSFQDNQETDDNIKQVILKIRKVQRHIILNTKIIGYFDHNEIIKL
jgi:hypothetical protein